MADGVPRIADDTSTDNVCAGCCMEKMRADVFPRHPANLVKSTSVLELVHTDVMGPMQTRSPGGCTFAVTFIDDYSRHVTVYFMKAKSEVLSKFKIFKASMENAICKTIKRLRSDNGGEYTDKVFKTYLDRSGIKHEKTVPYTPQQNELAERMNRSLVKMARCMLYHEGIDKKWWAEAINTAAWIINRIPNSVNVKTSYEIVHRTKPQLKNMKVFGSLGYAHIPDEKRRTLDPKAFKCRFMGYEDGVKGYRVLNVATGKVQIVRTVKFMETTDPDQPMNCLEMDEDEEAGDSEGQPEFLPPLMPASDVTSIVEARRQDMTHHDVTPDGAAITPYANHPMITRSRARHTDETTDPEGGGARKKQVVAPSEIRTKRRKVDQACAKADDEQLVIGGGMLMAETEEVPRSYDEATTSNNDVQRKAAIECELSSLMTNKTWKLVPRPKHQLAIGCRWVFALKRDETGRIGRHKARLRNFARTAQSSNSATSILHSCMGNWMKKNYMELPDGLMEILGDADGHDEDLVCLLEKSLYGLKQASRVWNETIDCHLKSMGFNPAKADPCVYTRDDNDQRCVVCLYVDDMLIAARDQDVIISVKAQIAENFKIKELGQARYILGIEIDYNMEDKTLGICQRVYAEAVIKKFRQEHANPSLIPLDTSVHLTKNDDPKTDEDKAKMRSKPYRLLIGSLMYLSCGTRPDISVSVAKLSLFRENPRETHWNAGIKMVKYLLKTKNVGILYDGALSSNLLHTRMLTGPETVMIDARLAV
ncbi:unnamed protein product [Phytophthora fragariaefolia]|uniref:Unnamed protein product n=1 Tax=Phytophthora fragariaefolia TaxID=1490495 RepID=A0A9W6U1K1_9STRA|nr:unnamed protein product [Phytophthora fragariaefolia]